MSVIGLGQRHFAFTLLVVLAVSGCGSPKGWSYAPEKPPDRIEPIVPETAVVLRFEDNRKNANKNRSMMFLVPLLPYGWMNYEMPEGASAHMASYGWQFRPVEDFTLAFTKEVQNARIFQEAFLGNRESEGDWVLTGDINSTRYKGKLLSYGLSFFGPMLWFIGLPVSTASNDLEVNLRLHRSLAAPPAWSYTIRGDGKSTTWMYKTNEDFLYSEIYKAGMRGAIDSLSAALPQLR